MMLPVHGAAAPAHQQRCYVLTHGRDEHHEEGGQNTGKAQREVLVQKRRQEVAPRSAAASTRSGWMRCKAALMGKAAENGIHT